MLDKKAELEIFRMEPDVDEFPRFDTFQLEYGEHTVLLDLLREIRDNRDGSLAFRSACRSGICGSCAMRVNGYAKLACQTRVADVVGKGPIILEPLGVYPAIKDLVVDLEPFWDTHNKVKPWLEPKSTLPDVPTSESLMSIQEVDKIKRLGDCILCASCTSSCNTAEVEKNFQGPAALAKACRFAADPRDALGAERGLGEIKPKGLYWCCYCNMCTEVCPKDVRPAEAISMLKGLGFTAGVPHDIGARRSLTFYDTVRRWGKINEGTLPIRAKGIGVLGYFPLGMRLLARGKLPSPFMDVIPRIKEVRTVYDNREAQGDGGEHE